MPKLTGVELVDEIRKRGIPRGILPKPFDLTALRPAVEHLAA